MNKLPVDTYGIHARAFPIYISVAPVVLALSSILSEGYDWKLVLGGGAIVLAPLSYLSKQIGGDLGKRRENAMWHKWGGPPTTRFLRHNNCELNQITRNRIHAKLRLLGLYVPSLEEQERNPTEADAFYEACTNELRRRTREKKHFPLVFKKLTEYGFRRNVVALKPIGLTIAALSFIACLTMAIYDWRTGTLSGSSLVPGVINIGLVIVWGVGFTEPAVKLTADRYAHFLLEAALDLEIEDGDNSLPER